MRVIGDWGSGSEAERDDVRLFLDGRFGRCSHAQSRPAVGGAKIC